MPNQCETEITFNDLRIISCNDDATDFSMNKIFTGESPIRLTHPHQCHYGIDNIYIVDNVDKLVEFISFPENEIFTDEITKRLNQNTALDCVHAKNTIGISQIYNQAICKMNM